MKRVAVIGGETHIEEVTNLVGKEVQIVGALVRDDQKKVASERFQAPLFDDEATLFAQARPDFVAVANENHLKASVVLGALQAGCDVIVDKPLAINMREQESIENYLRENPERRLLMLLTLRGQGMWSEVRRQVQSGVVGRPAFCHVRMAVQLMRDQRPPWFLDSRKSGGLFLDLLIHGIDQVEWALGSNIVAMTASMGNLGFPEDEHLRDHAAVLCELADGSNALIEGQRMLPTTTGPDYRMLVAGTQGYVDMDFFRKTLRVTSPQGADVPQNLFPSNESVVADWLRGGSLVDQAASLRANRLAILATQSAVTRTRVVVD